MFPEVGSTIVPPGLSNPFLSASSTTASAILSLTLRPGLDASSLTQTVAGIPAVIWLRRTSGVLPTASSTLAEIFIMSILPEFQQVNWELFFACDSLNADPFQPNWFEYTTRFPAFFHGLGIFQNLR